MTLGAKSWSFCLEKNTNWRLRTRFRVPEFDKNLSISVKKGKAPEEGGKTRRHPGLQQQAPVNRLELFSLEDDDRALHHVAPEIRPICELGGQTLMGDGHCVYLAAMFASHRFEGSLRLNSRERPDD